MTEPVNSIINQSFNSQEGKEPLNGDGFGLAWYAPEVTDKPAVFRDVSPAWNNLNLLSLARATRSSCILAHVRAATQGLPVIQLNCHPFSHGPFSFMHNGLIAGFQSIRRKLISRLSDTAFHAISGSTDSEHLFALFLDHFKRISRGGNRMDEMAAALTATIREVEELTNDAGIEQPSRLNLAVTDGSSVVASRHISADSDEANSLYVHAGTSFVCKDGHYQMVEPEKGNAVLVASEPLSGHKDWTKVPPNTMVLVHRDLKAEMRPLEL